RSHVLYPLLFLFLTDPATTATYTLSLHDALPISDRRQRVPRHRCVHRRGASLPRRRRAVHRAAGNRRARDVEVAPLDRRSAESRSEEHTSELQSLTNLVCRLLLEKKKQYRLVHQL